MLGRILLNCVEAFPKSWKDFIYRYSKRHVDYCEGLNDERITTNGELEIIRQFIPDCKIVFDVGTNIGEWAEFVLKTNPLVNLHCFEPSTATFQRLISKNFPPHVICNNFGLGSHPGEARLFVFGKGDAMNSLHQRTHLEDRGIPPAKSTETITLQTVDNYCQGKDIQTIDFLKIDVEGHELEVLHGSEKMLKGKRIGIIQFEYGGCNIDSRVLLKDLFDAFNGLPYEFYKIHPKGLKWVAGYSQQYENFQYSNWLAIHRKNPVLNYLSQR